MKKVLVVVSVLIMVSMLLSACATEPTLSPTPAPEETMVVEATQEKVQPTGSLTLAQFADKYGKGPHYIILNPGSPTVEDTMPIAVGYHETPEMFFDDGSYQGVTEMYLLPDGRLYPKTHCELFSGYTDSYLGGSPKVGFLTQMGEDGQVWQLVLISQFGMPTIVSRIADWDVTSNVDTVFDKFVPSSEWVESTLYIVDEPGAYDRDARLIQNLTKKQMYYGAFDVVYFENNTEKTVDNFDEPVTGYVRVEYDIDSGRYKVYVSKEKPDLDKLQKAMELANRAVRLYEDGDVPTFDGPVDACSWLKEADQIDVNVVSDLCGVYYVK